MNFSLAPNANGTIVGKSPTRECNELAVGNAGGRCEEEERPNGAHERQNLLMSSSMPQLDDLKDHRDNVDNEDNEIDEINEAANLDKECNSLTFFSMPSRALALGPKKSSSMSQRLLTRVLKSSFKSLNIKNISIGQMNSDADKTSLSTPVAKFQTQLSETLNPSKSLIMAEDDGGVYKGPPTDE